MSDQVAETVGQVVKLPAASIVVTGLNDRKRFNERKLKELAASIEAEGQKTAIIVRPRSDGRYDLCAGERRYRAMTQVLGWSEIPRCEIQAMDDDEYLSTMMVENTGRVQLDPIEEANAYQIRLARGWTIERVARTAGVSQDVVKRRVQLLQLAQDIAEFVANEQLPLAHAEALSALDTNRQHLALQVWNKAPGMSLVAFKEVVREYQQAADQESLFDLSSFWLQQVERMDSLPRRGKRAVTGAPVRADLPPVRIQGSTDNMAAIMDRFIADLLKAGKMEEAGAVANVYDALVRWNALSVPERSELLALHSEESVR